MDPELLGGKAVTAFGISSMTQETVCVLQMEVAGFSPRQMDDYTVHQSPEAMTEKTQAEVGGFVLV